MKASPVQRALAIAVILATGLIHLYLAPAAYRAVRYIGVLFVADGLGAFLAAFGLSRDRVAWGWGLGLLAALGPMMGYVLSRTVGMPGLPAMPDAWLDPWGVASLVSEGVFIGLFAVASRARA